MFDDQLRTVSYVLQLNHTLFIVTPENYDIDIQYNNTYQEDKEEAQKDSDALDSDDDSDPDCGQILFVSALIVRYQLINMYTQSNTHFILLLVPAEEMEKYLEGDNNDTEEEEDCPLDEIFARKVEQEEIRYVSQWPINC